MDEELLRRLDSIEAILRVGFREQILEARRALCSDPVNVAILDISSERWVSAGDLKSEVIKRTKQSESTVKRRIASLVSEGALETRGAGPSVSYRNTGLI